LPLTATFGAKDGADRRRGIPFRHCRNGSPFEYDLGRPLCTRKRHIEQPPQPAVFFIAKSAGCRL